MKFNVHGRFQIEVIQNDGWGVYRVGNGMRIPDRDIVIPSGTEPSEIHVFLDDIFHELAGPNTAIVLMAETE